MRGEYGRVSARPTFLKGLRSMRPGLVNGICSVYVRIPGEGGILGAHGGSKIPTSGIFEPLQSQCGYCLVV